MLSIIDLLSFCFNELVIADEYLLMLLLFLHLLFLSKGAKLR